MEELIVPKFLQKMDFVHHFDRNDNLQNYTTQMIPCALKPDEILLDYHPPLILSLNYCMTKDHQVPIVHTMKLDLRHLLGPFL